jgi:hypothetical protein
LIPQLALTSRRDDVSIRALHPEGPARTVFAATARGAGTAPAAERMLEVLEDTSTRYGKATS